MAVWIGGAKEFIILLNKHLLHISYVPDIALRTNNRAVNKTALFPQNLYCCRGRKIVQNM